MPEQTPAPVLLTLTLDTVTHYRGYDEDEQPVTIGDQVIEAATRKLTDDLRNEVKAAVLDAVAEQIKTQVAALIAETMTQPIQKTNPWGDPTGEPTSLRALIAKQAEDFISDGGKYDSFRSRREPSPIQVLVATEVNKAMEADLKEAIAVGRKKVDAAVKEKAAQLIADAVKVAGR